MTSSHPLRWISAAVLAAVVLAVLFVTVFGWNWLREPIERMALEKTGRTLAIKGDLTVKFGWLFPHVRAGAMTFANPGWAREKQMVTANTVDVTVDLLQLLRLNIVLPDVHLERPVVYLEQGTDGRKNWFMDPDQTDEGARIRIRRLSFDNGRLGYDDAAENTSIRATLSTSDRPPAGSQVRFTAQGQYKGLPLKASGSGGPVLALRDENTPYPLKAELTIGSTGIKLDGNITSLLAFSAMDVRLSLRGDSLAQLYPLLGTTFPETHAYITDGHLLHSGELWRYEKFSGRIGNSDIAGIFEMDTQGQRPAVKAHLTSQLLDFADLGPLIGVKADSLRAAARQALAQPARATVPGTARVLPDIPFKTEHWDSVDAEVSLSAKTIRRAEELPIEDLVSHLSLRDSVLKLDPLNFGVAGGDLEAVILLDGRKNPIQTHVQIKAKKIQIAKLFPTVDLNKTSVGEINGALDLSGRGASVRDMLATANGKVGLIAAGGEISRLMMEEAGLHLWEMLEIKVTRDKLVKLRCGIADFGVKEGVMTANALILDTEITTIAGAGSINLGQETFDITLNQKTKTTSPLALRSPILVQGSFVRPVVGVDKGHVAARGLGALALGIVNPLLAIIPLIDAGPGKDSDCGQLISNAMASSKDRAATK